LQALILILRYLLNRKYEKQTVTQNEKMMNLWHPKSRFFFQLSFNFFSGLFYMAAGAKGEFNYNKLSAGDKFQVQIRPYLLKS
jgi:hypothetical protein